MTRFVVVPQWQGSSSSRALQLIDGATAISAELPTSARIDVAVPLEAGETLGSGVQRWSSLRQTAARHREVLDAVAEPAVTVGGDAGVAVTAALTTATRSGTAVVWFSAHASLHDTVSSTTGAYDSMAVRALVDPGVPAAIPTRLDPALVLVAGVREIDPVESDAAVERGVTIRRDVDAEAIASWLVGTGASAVFVHVDLDVFDPSVLAGVADAVPFGPDLATVTGTITRIRAEAALTGAALTEFSPASVSAADDDLGTLLRLIGALA